jgi:hypothetical protein
MKKKVGLIKFGLTMVKPNIKKCYSKSKWVRLGSVLSDQIDLRVENRDQLGSIWSDRLSLGSVWPWSNQLKTLWTKPTNRIGLPFESSQTMGSV